MTIAIVFPANQNNLSNRVRDCPMKMQKFILVLNFGIDVPRGVVPLTKKPQDSGYEIALAPARVPGKAISANRGLHLPNHGINFIPQLDFVPESTININREINRLARSIKSLIGGKSL